MNKSAVTNRSWLDGELRLSGIDNKMFALLQAITETGSISQAAKYCGLSYKGAWQIIERANNASPLPLISTSTGGSKGGGACLTEFGKSLSDLFLKLQEEHRQFLVRMNQTLLEYPETRLLLQRLAVKTSVRNQFFGIVANIEPGAVNAKVRVNLSGDLPVEITLSLNSLKDLRLEIGTDAVLLINGVDIIVSIDTDNYLYSASNRLHGKVVRIQQNDINAEISVLLSNGEMLSSLITNRSASAMALRLDQEVWVMFKSNAPILGIKNLGLS